MAKLSGYQLETPDFGFPQTELRMDVLVKDFTGQVRAADDSILKGE